MTENELIAQWAGIECRCTYYSAIDSEPCSNIYVPRERYYGSCPRHSNGGNPPDYDRDEVAVSLLPVLVAKGYGVGLHSYIGDFIVRILKQCKTLTSANNELKGSAQQPTIAAAIKAAVLQLIKGEA